MCWSYQMKCASFYFCAVSISELMESLNYSVFLVEILQMAWIWNSECTKCDNNIELNDSSSHIKIWSCTWRWIESRARVNEQKKWEQHRAQCHLADRFFVDSMWNDETRAHLIIANAKISSIGQIARALSLFLLVAINVCACVHRQFNAKIRIC